MNDEKINDETQELINDLNEHSKNAGTVVFKVKYTAIPSNREIHKAFAKFCFEEANNNYLNGISKLLIYKSIFEVFERFEDRLSKAEYNLEQLRDFILSKENENEDNGKKESSEKTKTF